MSHSYIPDIGHWERQANKQAPTHRRARGVGVFMEDPSEEVTPKLGFAE